jgi:hypothetical protein
MDEMAENATKSSENEQPKAGSESSVIDWADLRAQAAKLGISLSEFQQRDREKKLRLAKKSQGRAPAPTALTE